MGAIHTKILTRRVSTVRREDTHIDSVDKTDHTDKIYAAPELRPLGSLRETTLGTSSPELDISMGLKPAMA